MRASRVLPVVALTVLLAACATEEGFRQRLQPFVGRSEVDLVRAFGVPTATFETGGVRFLQYESARTVTFPGSPPRLVTYERRGRIIRDWDPGTPPTFDVRTCRTTWQVAGNRVTGFSFEGSDCVARED
jgi:hypothetical protein